MNAVGNVGKISHNVSCLIQKDEHDDGKQDDDEVVKNSDETNDTETPLPQPANKDEDTGSEIEITHGKVKEATSTLTVDENAPPVNDKVDHIDPNQGEEEASSQEKSEDNEPSNDGD